MTIEEIKSVFALNDDKEFLKFDRIEVKVSNRPDLHAFILLDLLVPGTEDIVSGFGHFDDIDEIYISVDINELAKFVKEEHIIELIRCGVRYNEEHDCLCMFT